MNLSIYIHRTRHRILAATFLLGAALHAAGAAAAQDVEVGSYYTGWSAERGFRLKQLDEAGVAAKFTFLNYAFANVYQLPHGTYGCDGGRDIDDAHDGAGMKSSLDYANEFGAGESVSGSADLPDQPLAGNFNQLKQLKAKHPQLKVLLALGGGEWSRWFSAGAATPALRQALVKSCIAMYLQGDLPPLKGHGGKGAAAGVFDGFDLDWEHPGTHGAPYNTTSVHDRENFTLLLEELRTQLDALGKQQGKRYYLTAAVNSTSEKMAYTDPGKYARSLDWINLMTYDFHGAWNTHGPADFQSNLYPDPASPDGGKQSVETGVRRFIDAGVPARKIVVGVPFYARGWSGVSAANHGLYQSAAGPATGFEEGAELYANIAASSAPKFYHPVTKQLWTYADGTFWSYDDPAVIKLKAAYIREHRLGGIMSWALDQDDAAFSLSKAMLDVRGAQ